MSRTLVWMTHSFRADSRLTSLLSGECAFVYYSPYHFAGERERGIYQTCSQENLDAFYYSINAFDKMLADEIKGNLAVFREQDPVAHLNHLIKDYGITKVVIDQPLFALWHGINVSKINVPCHIIDSDLIDNTCVKMTAKSRWTTHVKNAFAPHVFSDTITSLNIASNKKGTGYPKVACPDLVNPEKVMEYAFSKIYNYQETRNRHDGQTRLSVALHNGVIDPANVFYAIANQFQSAGHNVNQLDGPAASILRQQAFREISIIQARRHNLTLEDTPYDWACKLMHIDALTNMVNAHPAPDSNINIDTIREAKTGVQELDFLLLELKSTGIMPNRARMYFASRMFYESSSGIKALENTIATFDLMGMDGQSPNNYTQCIGALGLSYGKVLKMNRDRAFEMLDY
jgi:deoxyribodipyrimidine photolyase